MVPRPLLNPTHQMGEPADWDREGQGSSVETLQTIHTGGWHKSLWKLSDQEINEIKKSGTVVLCIHGKGHPVVALQVLDAVSVDKYVDTTQEDIRTSMKLQQGSDRVN